MTHIAERSMEPSWTQGLEWMVSSGIILLIDSSAQPVCCVFRSVHTSWGQKGCQKHSAFILHHQVQWEIGFSSPAGLAHPKVPELTQTRQKQFISRTLSFTPCFSIVFLATVSLVHLFLAYLWPEVQDTIFAELGSTNWNET